MHTANLEIQQPWKDAEYLGPEEGRKTNCLLSEGTFILLCAGRQERECNVSKTFHLWLNPQMSYCRKYSPKHAYMGDGARGTD